MTRLMWMTFVWLPFALTQLGCAHPTSMNDPALSSLWRGDPIDDKQIADAKQKWMNDVTLLDMQEGVNLLRRGDLASGEDAARAHNYLESAFNTFDDLRDPENFSKAFTTDSQTPYRGRPYERMMTAILLALLDAAKGRCDMALPALKAAEFLDARWQPFLFGSDAPMVYALMLRCMKEARAPSADVDRAKDGLERSLRMQLLLGPLLEAINDQARYVTKQSAAHQVALTLAEVGVASALISAPGGANIDEILRTASDEALRFLPRALKDNEAPYDEIIRPLLRKMDANTDEGVSAAGFSEVQEAYQALWSHMLATPDFRHSLNELLDESQDLKRRVEAAAQKPVAVIHFNGVGPSLIREGQYQEIARIAPQSFSDDRPGVARNKLKSDAPCGVSNLQEALTFVLCKGKTQPLDGELLPALRLWATSFQATTTAGRRFDRILKGRAQFRMGTEVAALIGGVVALQLLEASFKTIGQTSDNLRGAALVVGAVAGAAWLAGRATNPEADIRHVINNFESGYLATF